MVLSGDEIGHTQQGNNNAYCQDNEISWLDWDDSDEDLRRFTQRLIALRREHPSLHRQRFFSGQLGRGHKRQDIAWFRRDGKEMTNRHWTSGERQSLGMLLNGEMIRDRGPRGERIVDDTLLVLLHSHHEDTRWQMPTGWGARWEVLVDTALPDEPAGTRTVGAGEALPVTSRSLVILRSRG
jgi:glycogen operon protein